MDMSYAEIAVPKPLFRTFFYKIPAGLEAGISQGMRVSVPFQRQQIVGYVIATHPLPPPNIDSLKIKEVSEVLDKASVFSKAMLDLIGWMASYYCAPIGEVCRTALPPRLHRLKGPRLTRPTTPMETIIWPGKSPSLNLNNAQHEALKLILDGLKGHGPKPILLHGITGSGKTEIYLRAFEEIKKRNGQGILLVPEISLTPQLVQGFRERFGDAVAIYHSGLTEAQRQNQWEKMQRGEVFAAVGTRSAIFAPFQNLSIIIVDEEHDSSYKQDEGFLYNARDAAIMRARFEGTLAILGSATPSIESFANTRTGKYIYLYLPDRATGAKLPQIEIVDMRQHRTSEKSSLSNSMVTAIRETLEKKEQTLLLLNRRGFANFLLCKSCGHVVLCPNCDISLTHHISPARLICHYCSYESAPPDICPECRGIEIKNVGRGTQMLEEELAKLFPDASIARLDRDTTAKKSTRQNFLSKMQKGEIDILMGTQLVAKGHDFPNITLVGVVDADVSLHLPDFRSFEKTFQILTQVAGRAGRADKEGRVIIQTYQPDHPSIIFAKGHDYSAFFEREREFRQALKYPPFARIANIRFSSNKRETTAEAAKFTLSVIKNEVKKVALSKYIDVLGPAPSPIEKMRNKFRWQLLIKAANARCLSTLLHNISPHICENAPYGCRIVIDVDPVNMM